MEDACFEGKGIALITVLQKHYKGNINDWKIVYAEKYRTKEEVLQRELQVKS